MSDILDTIIVGGGVIGLAIARQLAMRGRDVAVLEAEAEIGTHTSSRNSEVIHAGIYYPQGSLKATLCVTGRELLYEYCERRKVPHRRIGKIIVASGKDGEQALQQIIAKGRANGVTDLRELSKTQVNAREPTVIATSGILSPSTGIIDSHQLLASLLADIESADGVVVVNSRVERIVAVSDGFDVLIAGDSETTVRCRNLVNAAGLWAPSLAAAIEGLEARHVPTAYFAKAHYFSYVGRSPLSMLVYPLPEDGGLGIHATLDMAGALRFGPDVTWVDEVSYDFDDSRKDAFVAAIRSYWPGVDESRLSPGYTGMRPKVSGPGEAAADFRIDGSEMHGMNGLVNLFGIESPGLTACLAIAEHVTTKLEQRS